MKRTSTLRHVFDERAYDHMRAASRAIPHNGQRMTKLGEYAREGRRIGWTWALIADALRVTPSTARRYRDAYVASLNT